MGSKTRLVLDFGPLLMFFLGYRYAGLPAATIALIAATLISLTVTYAKEKKIAMMPLVSGILVTLFGGLTLLLHDEYFIKIKPTIINLLFAAILLGGLLFRKPMFKYVFGHAFQLTETGWRKLSFRGGIFFILLAAVNETVWRNFPTETWVNFKVFGIMPLTMLFMFSQLPLIQRYWVEEEQEHTSSQ